MIIPTLTMLVALSGPVAMQAPEILVQADSAHTPFTPNASDPGRAGQVYSLPQGGVGVTTGGTSHYQTYSTPGGSGVAVPSGNNNFSAVGSAGQAGTAHGPR